LLRNGLALASLAAIAAVTAVAVFAPQLPLADPNVIDTTHRLMPPLTVWPHPLGTDALGRDLLSRIVWGGRLSLTMGVVAAVLALVVGVTLGVAAGYGHQVADHAIMRTMDVVMAFPFILLAIALVAALGPGLVNAMLAIAVVGIPQYARLARGAVLSVKVKEYVDAARALGAGDVAIMLRHVLPNIAGPIVVMLSLDIGGKIIATASLSFLGLGTQPPTADWGSMLADGRNYLGAAPHVATLPGLMIFLVALAYNLAGDGVRDVLDPRFKP